MHLGIEEPSETRRHPCFVTDDLAAARARCEAAGYRTIDDPGLPGVARFYVVDSFGNRIELMEVMR